MRHRERVQRRLKWEKWRSGGGEQRHRTEGTVSEGEGEGDQGGRGESTASERLMAEPQRPQRQGKIEQPYFGTTDHGTGILVAPTSSLFTTQYHVMGRTQPSLRQSSSILALFGVRPSPKSHHLTTSVQMNHPLGRWCCGCHHLVRSERR